MANGEFSVLKLIVINTNIIAATVVGEGQLLVVLIMLDHCLQLQNRTVLI